MRKDDEPRLRGLGARSLKELGVRPGKDQFVVWADTEQDPPIALVCSGVRYTMDGGHTDRWGLVPVYFVKEPVHVFWGVLSILVKPDEPLFAMVTDANGAKEILLERSGIRSRLSDKQIREILKLPICIQTLEGIREIR